MSEGVPKDMKPDVVTFSTADARRTPRFHPIVDFGLSRPDAARMVEIHGLGSRRASCPPVLHPPRAQPDPALVRQLLLGPLERRLHDLGHRLGLAGQTSRLVALAFEIAQQGLRWPVEPETRLISADGRRTGVVVGVKPAGFLEQWQMAEARRLEDRGDRFARSRLGRDEHLVWTVDPDAGIPGISQSRLSDWRADGG